MTTPRRLRLIAWGTGAVGSEMVTTILDHRPDMEIVGARMYSPAKDGADIGTLVGRDPIGVAATSDSTKILALQADCVLYTPRNTSIDEVCALLSSGKNVATTAFVFHPRRAEYGGTGHRHPRGEVGGGHRRTRRDPAHFAATHRNCRPPNSAAWRRVSRFGRCRLLGLSL